MALFAHPQKIPQLAAAGDVAGLREVLVDAGRHGCAEAETISAAAAALVDLGEDGVYALLDAVLSQPDQVQFGWIDEGTFHRAASPVAVAQVSGVLLRHPDAHLRLVACTLLRRLGTPLSDEAFALALEDDDPHVRLSAARGLAEHDDARGVRALVDWAAHADDPVPALIGFARLADPRLLPVLEKLRDSRSDPRLRAEFERTIGDIRAARGHRRGVGAAARLEAVRDRLRSIEVVDRLAGHRPGVRSRGASELIRLLCDAIDHAVATLRSGHATDGQVITSVQVGTRLAAVVADARAPDFSVRLGSVLEPRGVRAVLSEIADLERIATELQEHSASHEGADG